MKGIDILASRKTDLSYSHEDIGDIIGLLLGKSAVEKARVFPNNSKETCYLISLPGESFSGYKPKNIHYFPDELSRAQKFFYDLSVRLEEAGFTDISAAYR